MRQEQLYHYISVKEFAKSFKSFHVGKAIKHELATPFNKHESHPAALTRTKYGTTKIELMKACLFREVTLMKRSAYLFTFKSVQVSNIGYLCLCNRFVGLNKYLYIDFFFVSV